MKRLWSTPEFIKAQELRRRKLEQRRQSGSKRRRRARLVAWSSPERLITAPRALQLFGNDDDAAMTLEFCESIRKWLDRQENVRLDFGRVKSFRTDALLLIRAITTTRRGPTMISGNLPSDPGVAAEFKATGFFQGFTKPPADMPKPKGIMLQKSRNFVTSDEAARIVDFAEKHTDMPAECRSACYRSLVELMSNTKDHSAGRKRKWFASVYCRDGTAYFNFLDLGVGILRSRTARGFLRRVKESVASYGSVNLLKAIFKGRVESISGLPWRGNGLPNMKTDAEHGHLPRLQVLTSDVVGSVCDVEFRSRRRQLRGTAFRWEVT